MISDAPPPYAALVFDCDSTLSAIEGIDELALGHKREIAALTDRAMRGELALEEVYEKRLALVQPSRRDVEEVGALYVRRALPHAKELVAAARSLSKRVCIVSGGLLPAVHVLSRALGFAPGDVFAVGVQFDADGRYSGFDHTSPLARTGGKIQVVGAIARAVNGPLCLVGDGATDLEAAGEAARFVAFGGVVRRENVFARSRITCETADLAALAPLVFSRDELELLRTKPEHAALLRAARISD
ncbi:MAG: HAD-IB family phosphatase [Planctomycetes bacterium]|nr:HAD-IB family phosphatase [Planctomycetota bacterium]